MKQMYKQYLLLLFALALVVYRPRTQVGYMITAVLAVGVLVLSYLSIKEIKKQQSKK